MNMLFYFQEKESRISKAAAEITQIEEMMASPDFQEDFSHEVESDFLLTFNPLSCLPITLDKLYGKNT